MTLHPDARCNRLAKKTTGISSTGTVPPAAAGRSDQGAIFPAVTFERPANLGDGQPEPEREICAGVHIYYWHLTLIL